MNNTISKQGVTQDELVLEIKATLGRLTADNLKLVGEAVNENLKRIRKAQDAAARLYLTVGQAVSFEAKGCGYVRGTLQSICGRNGIVKDGQTRCWSVPMHLLEED